MHRSLITLMSRTCGYSICMLLLGLTGCSGQQKYALAYHEVVQELLDPLRIARLDTPQAEIVTSHDRTGGNTDYSNYMGQGPGDWKILADLQGPGVVTRFWTTGGHSRNQRLRFYFDSEKSPRIDATIDELSRGDFPFPSLLSRYEQGCWLSYVPMTYAKRLIVMAEMEKPQHEAKLFYQVNYSSLEGTRVQTYPKSFSNMDRKALTAVHERWMNPGVKPSVPPMKEVTLDLAADSAAAPLVIAGPGMISELMIALRVTDDVSIPQQEEAIAGCRIRVNWDGAEGASMDMPIAKLCGRIWNCPAYDSLYFGFRDHAYRLRFPMPFNQSASFQVVNAGSVNIEAVLKIYSTDLPAGGRVHGYLHAVSSQSTPGDVGKAHTLLRAKGSGKYAGCYLGALTIDNSWWLLEGDERIRVDSEAHPGWHGTGLEDYFNGAWYYQVPIVRPLHALTFKVPFKTLQYRLHAVDARRFVSSIDAEIERGPDNASRGWMESVSYYYLDTPSAAQVASVDSVIPAKFDPLEQVTVMTTLASFERFDDYDGASRYIDVFLSKYPDYQYAPILRLRKIAYVERRKGIEEARPLYEGFLAKVSDPAARQMAKLLLWFHEDPGHAILSVFCSPPTRAYVDERLVATTRDSRLFNVYPLRLSKGKHVLALETTHRRYPDWVQACLRTHTGMIGTSPVWLFELNPPGNWRQVDYDTSLWKTSEASIRTGPPPAPDIYTSPHAFVDLQSVALGLWAPKEWPREIRTGVFRTVFNHPMSDSD